MSREKPYSLSKSQWLKYFEIYNFNGRLYVNRKYRPQLKDHATLRKLIKAGVFKQHREGFSRSCRHTYLTINVS